MQNSVDSPENHPGYAVTPQASHKRLILLVDDSIALRNIIQRGLESQGYQLLTAGDGSEAWDLLNAGQPQPDLVITDMDMPKMGGLKLAEKIFAQFPEMKVIFMSGTPGERILLEAALGHDVAFIGKPFEMPVLLEMLRSSLVLTHP
jgi:two-component system, cell cycle sensor histidine kinase and response regulator CckA